MAEQARTSLPSGTSQRATIACQSCRQRKIKCDAQSAPPGRGCNPCRRAKQDCLLDPLSDGRRSISQKMMDKLQQRIATLEALNQRTGDRTSWGLGDNGANLSEDPLTASRASDMAQPVDIASRVPTQNGDITHPTLLRMVDPPQQSQAATATMTETSPEGAHGTSPTYYGATCHPHVVSPGEESHHVDPSETDVVDIALDPASPCLQNQLLRFFFKYQTLWVVVVDKEMFLTHKAAGHESRWYSKFLEHAMLACGARVSTSKAVRALGSTYCKWARDETMRAMSEPTSASLQGFLLLSEYEVTQGNDRPGWMHCGVACRMLSDLGLHGLANASSPSAVAAEQTREGDLAYGLLSACVVYEGVWTLYLGRPSSIPRSVMSIAASRCKEGRKTDSPWLNAWVALCVPMAEISHVLNEQLVGDADKMASLLQLSTQLEQWYATLPPELAYNESRLTNMDLAGYGLHTQYCKVQILLQQALPRSPNTRKRKHSHTMGDSTPYAPPNDTKVAIYHYALRIARLVVTYRETFGVEKIPSIMLDNAVVAATVLVEYINNADPEAEVQQQKTWLRHLVRSMETVQLHFPVVTRMLDTLREICGHASLDNMLSPTRRLSTNDAPAHESPAPRGSLDMVPRPSHYSDNFSSLGNDSDAVWGFLDTEVSSSILSSGALSDFIFDFASSEVLAPHMAPPVP